MNELAKIRDHACCVMRNFAVLFKSQELMKADFNY